MLLLEEKALADWSEPLLLLAAADQLEEAGELDRAAAFRAVGEGRVWLYDDPRSRTGRAVRFDLVVPFTNGFRVANRRMAEQGRLGPNELIAINGEMFDPAGKFEWERAMHRHGGKMRGSFASPDDAVAWLAGLIENGLFA